MVKLVWPLVGPPGIGLGPDLNPSCGGRQRICPSPNMAEGDVEEVDDPASLAARPLSDGGRLSVADD